MSGTGRPRSVPLAERKAEARDLDRRIREHRPGCPVCASDDKREVCGEGADMRDTLRRLRSEIRAWHAPGPDDVPLFDLSELQP